MQKRLRTQLRTCKGSFTLASLLALMALTCITAVANAQETEATSTEPVATETTAPANLTNDLGADITLSTEQQIRIRNLAANISNQLDSTAARLTNIIGRLESRLALVAAEGRDITPATTALTGALTNLNNAQTKLSTIDVSVSAVVSGTNPAAAWRTLQTEYQDIYTTLQTTRTELATVITLTRNATVPTSVGTSTTPN